MKRKIVTVAEDDLDDDKDPELRRILEESRLEAVARQVSKTKAMKTESGRVFPANTGPRISMQLDLIIRNPLEGGKREMTTVPLHAIRESKTISEILEMQDDAKLLQIPTRSDHRNAIEETPYGHDHEENRIVLTIAGGKRMFHLVLNHIQAGHIIQPKDFCLAVNCVAYLGMPMPLSWSGKIDDVRFEYINDVLKLAQDTDLNDFWTRKTTGILDQWVAALWEYKHSVVQLCDKKSRWLQFQIGTRFQAHVFALYNKRIAAVLSSTQRTNLLKHFPTGDWCDSDAARNFVADHIVADTSKRYPAELVARAQFDKDDPNHMWDFLDWWSSILLRWSHDNAELEIWLDYVNLHPYELLPREAIPLRTGGALPQRESSGLDVKGGALPRHESSALDVKGDKSFAVLDLNSSKSSALSSGNACGVSSLLKPISGSVEPKRTAAPKELKNGGNLFSFPLLWFTTAKQAVHLFVRAPIASRRMMEWHFKFRFVDLAREVETYEQAPIVYKKLISYITELLSVHHKLSTRVVTDEDKIPLYRYHDPCLQQGKGFLIPSVSHGTIRFVKRAMQDLFWGQYSPEFKLLTAPNTLEHIGSRVIEELIGVLYIHRVLAKSNRASTLLLDYLDCVQLSTQEQSDWIEYLIEECQIPDDLSKQMYRQCPRLFKTPQNSSDKNFCRLMLTVDPPPKPHLFRKQMFKNHLTSAEQSKKIGSIWECPVVVDFETAEAREAYLTTDGYTPGRPTDPLVGPNKKLAVTHPAWALVWRAVEFVRVDTGETELRSIYKQKGEYVTLEYKAAIWKKLRPLGVYTHEGHLQLREKWVPPKTYDKDCYWGTEVANYAWPMIHKDTFFQYGGGSNDEEEEDDDDDDDDDDDEEEE